MNSRVPALVLGEASAHRNVEKDLGTLGKLRKVWGVRKRGVAFFDEVQLSEELRADRPSLLKESHRAEKTTYLVQSTTR